MMTQDNTEISFIDGLDEYLSSTQAPKGWFQKRRLEGLSRFQELGVPTVKDEEWKYVNLTPLTQNKFTLKTSTQSDKVEGLQKYLGPKDINLIFINGIFSDKLSNLKEVKGLRIQTFQKAVETKNKPFEDLMQKQDAAKETVFAALNRALAQNGIFIEIEKGAVIEELLHIIHLSSANFKNGLNSPRTLIVSAKSSEATVLESHLCFSDDVVYFANALTDIFVSENATLHYCKAQKESMKAFHIGNTRVHQERNANFTGFSLMVGASITRNNLDIMLDGEGSSAILDGLYCATKSQLVDNHSAVDHRQPNCTSNQYYKGVLNEASRGVFNGKIFVRQIAQKTNSYQLNKNLLLGKEALINTKPQLEIFADDVKCTHGATIGQLNEDEIFYLQTRCISKQDAVKMLSKAFIDDIINTIQRPAIQQKLHILLEPTLAQF